MNACTNLEGHREFPVWRYRWTYNKDMETWNKKKGHGEPEDISKPFLYGERRLHDWFNWLFGFQSIGEVSELKKWKSCCTGALCVTVAVG
jgi:hypothetical protein